MKKGIIIFSGFNVRAIIAFIRTLEKRNLSFGIIAISEDDEIFKTKYKDRVLVIRNKKELDINDIYNSIKKLKRIYPKEKYLIAPSTEALNRFLLEYRELFSEMRIIIPLVNKKLYETISDKEKFIKICSNFGIKYPNTYYEIIDIPFVAKPKKYYSENGKVYNPFLIMTKKDKEKFINTYNINDFIYQEYVPGKSFYLLYYFFKDGKFIKFSQENLIQQENGKSILLAKSSNFHNSYYSKSYETMLKKLKFNGLIMIEVRYNAEKAFMIEANPRFWGPSQLFVDSGVNLFEAFLFDYNYLDNKPIITYPQKDIYYFWDDGISKNFQKRKKLAFYNFSIKNFKENLKRFKQIEIFNREDTKSLSKVSL